MSEPGSVERVPLKVVPYYVEPLPVDETTEPPEIEVVPEPATTPLVGLVAALLALATIIVHAVAITVATAGDFATATVLGYVAIGLSIAAVLGGVFAAITQRGRRIGIGAAIVAIVANPFVLLSLLRLVDF